MGYRDLLTGHGMRATMSTALNEISYPKIWVDAQLSHVGPAHRLAFCPVQVLAGQFPSGQVPAFRPAHSSWASKRKGLTASDDEMIQQLDVDKVQCRLQLPSGSNIGLARGGQA